MGEWTQFCWVFLNREMSEFGQSLRGGKGETHDAIEFFTCKYCRSIDIVHGT